MIDHNTVQSSDELAPSNGFGYITRGRRFASKEEAQMAEFLQVGVLGSFRDTYKKRKNKVYDSCAFDDVDDKNSNSIYQADMVEVYG